MAANIYDEPLNGPSLTPLKTAVQTKGGAVQLLYNTNAQEVIAEGASGSDIRYVIPVRPGTRNYRARSRVSWGAPGVTGHIHRLFIRYDKANKNGYYVEVDSGLGSPTIKLYRIVGGVATQLGSTFTIPSALVADLQYTVELEAVDDILKVYWNGNEDPDNPDMTATDGFVYTQGYVGFGTLHATQSFGGTVRIQHVEINTPYDTGIGIPSPSGTLLKVDGVEYDEAALLESNIYIVSFTKSIVGVDSLELVQKTTFTDATFRPEQIVELFVDINGERTRVFHGKIRVRPQSGSAPEETISYTCYGYRANWQYVKIRHPETLSPQIVWNALVTNVQNDEKDPDYDQEFANLSTGAFLKKIFDQNKDKIHFHFGADPKGGQPVYAEGTLDSLTINPAKTVVRGNLDQFMLEVLGLEANKAPVMDYDKGQFLIRDLSSLVAKDLSFTGLRLPKVDINLETSAVYTAAEVTGVNEEIVEEILDYESKGIKKGNAWDSNLESEWTPERAQRQTQGYIIGTYVAGGGPAGRDLLNMSTTAVNEETFANEWQGTTIEITTGPADGDKLQIFSHTGKKPDGTYDFIVAGNLSAAPSPGNRATVSGYMSDPTTNNRNKFFYVYRLFQIADETKRNIDRTSCADLGIEYGKDTETILKSKLRPAIYGDLPKDTSDDDGHFLVNEPVTLPEVGIVNWLDNTGACGVQEDRTEAIIETGGAINLKYKYKKTTVASVRWPEADNSYYGPAFSKNSLLWEAADAKPELGDLGVTRVEDIEDSGFKYSAQKADWLAILEERVKWRSLMPWSGTVTYRGLDWDNILFTKKLTLSSAARSTTGWESEDLIPISWTWNFLTNTNEVQIGTSSIFAREIEKAKRSTSLERTVAELEAKMEQFRQFQECMQKGNPSDDGRDPNPIGDQRVKTSATTTQRDFNRSNEYATKTTGPGQQCPPPTCLKWMCDSGTVTNPGQVISNAALLEKLRFSMPVPKGWKPGSGALSAITGLDTVRTFLACFMKDMVGALAAQDTELGKTQIDLQNMGTAIGTLSNCIQNSRIQPIQDKVNELATTLQAICMCLLYNDFRLAWCLSGKLDGGGAYCDIDTGCCHEVAHVESTYCNWKFDPKMCDPKDCGEIISAPSIANEAV